MIRLAIFDLDGTLLDTVDDLAVACNRALRIAGLPEHPNEAYKQFVGNGVHNLMQRILPEKLKSDEALKKRLYNDFSEYYAEHAQDYTKIYDGVADALQSLKHHGVQIAVLSNKPDAYTGDLVKQYFPGLVDVAYGQREGVPIKPDPTAVHEIIKVCGCKAEECIYIGDTGTDMQTGNNAGLITIGVLWGFRTKDELQRNGAKYIIDKAEQLVEIIVDKLAV